MFFFRMYKSKRWNNHNGLGQDAGEMVRIYLENSLKITDKEDLLSVVA